MGGKLGAVHGSGLGAVGQGPPSGGAKSQSLETVAGNSREMQTLQRHRNNVSSPGDETLAIKISTTTPVLHQETREIGFAWHVE
jgi:hypothetical protein